MGRCFQFTAFFAQVSHSDFDLEDLHLLATRHHQCSRSSSSLPVSADLTSAAIILFPIEIHFTAVFLSSSLSSSSPSFKL